MAGELLAPGRILRLRLATAPAAHPHGDSGKPGHWRPCLTADCVHPLPERPQPPATAPGTTQESSASGSNDYCAWTTSREGTCLIIHLRGCSLKGARVPPDDSPGHGARVSPAASRPTAAVTSPFVLGFLIHNTGWVEGNKLLRHRAWHTGGAVEGSATVRARGRLCAPECYGQQSCVPGTRARVMAAAAAEGPASRDVPDEHPLRTHRAVHLAPAPPWAQH